MKNFSGTQTPLENISIFLRKAPVLFELPNQTINDLATCAEPYTFPPNTIFSTGTNDESKKRFLIIKQGQARALDSQLNADNEIPSLGVGDYAGAVTLLRPNAQHTKFRVTSTTKLHALGFDALTFHRKIVNDVLIFRSIHNHENDSASTLHFFANLPTTSLLPMLKGAKHTAHSAGEVIYAEGDEAERFYILLRGTALVTQNGETVTRLSSGDFFGETSLLLDRRRTTTVYAESECLSWSIDRKLFDEKLSSTLLKIPTTQSEILRRMDITANDGL